MSNKLKLVTTMPTAITMPDFGTAVDEIRLVKWLVSEGATVQRGDLLAEIETDKASSELESAAEGVILKLVTGEGTAVASGTILAYAGVPGEAIPEPEPAAARVSPVVRNLASKLGVDLSKLSGSGVSGVITREDVLRAAKSAPPLAASRAQAAIARTVERSAREIPHFGVTVAIEMTAAERLRRESGAGYEAIFIRAMAMAAGREPLFVAGRDGVHIGLAVGTGNDLFIPVIRDADRKSLPELQREIEALAADAAKGVFKPEAMTGASMSLSNLGMYPVESFEAIIFPGQSAILALGRVERQPVVVEDRVEISPRVKVHLSADHRIINGRTAAAFLARVKEAVELGLGEGDA